MKSKEIAVLAGVLILIVVFAVWGSHKGGGDLAQNPTQEGTVTNTNPPAYSPTKKPGSTATSPTPGSVNPTVVPQKTTPTIPTTKSLAGSTFRLTTYNGSPLPADTKFTLSFTENSFTLKICNTFTSTYFLENDRVFKATNVNSTQTYCSYPSNVMKIDSDASIMLNGSNTTIYRSGSTLILSNPSGTVLSFEGF